MNFLFDTNTIISIYGVGGEAGRLIELFDKGLINRLRCFVVSDGRLTCDSFCEKPVIEFSTYSQNDNEVLILAISKSHIEEIIESIIIKGVSYYVLSDDDRKTLFRVKNAYNTKDFICQTKPVSSIFGLDRGKAIDRYYIEKFLRREIFSLGRVEETLEVGDSAYSSLLFPKARHGILDYSKGMDLTKPTTIRQNYYDVFICTQTFNFIFDVKGAVRGSYGLLKPGGTLLATVAGNISQVSRYDMDRWGDYWRFTYRSIDLLVGEVFGSNVKVHPFGNPMAATAFVQGLCVEDVSEELLDECDPDYAIVIGIVAKKGND